MKKLFSFLFLFSAFTLVALPFFLNPSFALAEDYTCSCDATANTYTSCTANADCVIHTNQPACDSDADCVWSNGTGLDPSENPTTNACQASDPVCDTNNCFTNNREDNCCNNFTAQITCGFWCDIHSNCQPMPDNKCWADTCVDCTGNSNPSQTCCNNSLENSTCGQAIPENYQPCSDCNGNTGYCNQNYGSTNPNIINCTSPTETITGSCTCTSAGSGKEVVSATQAECDACDVSLCGDIGDEGTCVWSATLPTTETGNAPITETKNTNPTVAAPLSLKNPLGVNTVPELVKKVINVALGVVGSLALIMFIYGGFTWMLAAGNEQAVEKGRNILVWATIGLVVIFASYSLVNFIITSLVK